MKLFRCSTGLSYKSFDLAGFEPTTDVLNVVPTAFTAIHLALNIEHLAGFDKC
ncbi:MAG: hypothetical protein AAB336_05475 [Acidobacteriota bacterium]